MTYLWLKGLEPLKATNIVEPLGKWVNGGTGSNGIAHNAKVRSKTFPGIAKAMAEQWG